MNNFFKSFLSFGLAVSIEKLLGFIVLPIYTTYFNTEEYGIIDLISTMMMVVVVFGILQLETSLQRYYYEFNESRKKLLISTIYFWIIVASVAVALVLYFFSGFLSFKLFGSSQYVVLIKLMSLQVPLQNLSVIGLVILRYERSNSKFLGVIITKVLTSLLAIYICVIYFEMGMRGVFIAQLSSIFCSTFLVTWFIRKYFVFKLPKWVSAKSFRYALPMFPARVGSMILGQSNRFFILGFLSISAIGVYSVSIKLASIIQIFNMAFNMAWAPFMHQQFKNEQNKDVFSKAFIIVCSVTFLCVCLISLFSIEMVKILTASSFYESYRYVGGLTLFYALYIIKETVDIGPKLKEKTKYLSFTFFVSVIVNVISLYFLAQHYALIGVVIAMVVTNLVLVMLSWAVSNRLYYIPFSISIFIVLLIPAIVIALAIMMFEITFLYRLLIALLILTFYITILLKYIKEIKKIVK
ncbi:O-antigen/teichoic acid export membrane protein [Flavobacterium arsenatis]|uniref:O-antigen/teichoic acid export membrane protein n=1 Tax=Flavobacterium arsenatis TaxID=1484332 RepID=A0ABU1TQN7_9FLAO|nr:oligosaccharide flippase family protein [Flavobacterium arsenatis]MDR6968285.1 O-antigen/teichoic acid export membrane protein [Flavobacterium arsenatis]